MLEAKRIKLEAGGRVLTASLSTAVEDGQILCISGREGSGKSLLLKAFMGLVPVSDGFVSFDGELLITESAEYFRRMIAYVPQHLSAIYGDDVFSSIVSTLFSLEVNRQKTATALRLVSETAANLGLRQGVTEMRWTELTVAERYLLLIILAAIQEKSLVLIDEPSAKLSERETEHVVTLISEIARKGAAVVVVSNEIRIAEVANVNVML